MNEQGTKIKLITNISHNPKHARNHARKVALTFNIMQDKTVEIRPLEKGMLTGSVAQEEEVAERKTPGSDAGWLVISDCRV